MIFFTSNCEQDWTLSEIMFTFGVMIKNLKITDSLKKIKLSYKILITFGLVIILGFCSKIGTISIAGRSIINPLFYCFVSISGFLLIFYCSYGIAKLNFFKTIFVYLGEHTIPILALHTLAFKLVTFLQYKIYSTDFIVLAAYPVWKNSLMWSLLYMFVGASIPLLLTYPFSKIKIIKKLFLI